MEREKKSNVGLYICLIVLVFLVGIGTGYFLYKNKNKVEPTDILNTENAENSEKAITKSDAETILKDLYNAAVRHIFNESVSYCGDVDINDTGIILNDFHYYKSSSFKSFEELDNYLKNFMTESLLKNSNYNNSVVDEGIVIESYYEKNGSLYCNYWNKGGNVDLENYLDKESTFSINNISNNSFDGIINAVYSDADNNYKTNLKIKVSVVNQNGKWLLNTYEQES